MIYRKALKSDIPALVALEQELFNADNYPISRAMFRYHVANNMLLVAQDADGIAGYILLLKRKGWRKIYSIGVASAKRSQGVASGLLHAMFASLTCHEKRVLLEVRSDNSGAIALYEKHGFVKIKEIAHFYKDGCSAYIMQKSL